MKSTKPVTCIDDLPPEMIHELFGYLHLKDLAACSMVNKRWCSIYAVFKLHSLVVSDFASTTRDLLDWYDSNRRIEEAEKYSWSMFCRLAAKPLLSNLKQLALSGCYNLKFDLNELNCWFSQLLHLEIDIPFFGVKVHLNLPKLRVLAIHKWDNCCHLLIDCPLLSTLLYQGDANLLDVKHPETIRKLETNLAGSELDPFKNVECLLTRSFEAISQATLLSLSRLRELRYNKGIERLVVDEFRNVFGRVDRMKRTLSEFMDEAKKLKGRDFRFTFAGLQLTNVNVDHIDFGVHINRWNGREEVCNEYVYMKYYHLIEPGALQFIKSVDYTLLLRHVTGEFPHCFFQKFTGIDQVIATAEVPDTNHLLWFLKSLRSLRSLYLADTGLGQEFCDQLPEFARSLVSLNLTGKPSENELWLNFDFLGKLSDLSNFEIRPLSLESANSLVLSSDGLASCTFYVKMKSRLVRIQKGMSSTEWAILKGFQALLMTNNRDEIINFINH